jgi:hypothetical protein
MPGKEEVESGSGCEQLEEKSGNEEESSEQPPKKKRYHRHTARQIQEMEAYVTNFCTSLSLIFLFLKSMKEYIPLIIFLSRASKLPCRKSSLPWIICLQNQYFSKKTKNSTLP